MSIRTKHIPIFIPASDATVPYLAVTLQSISEHASEEYIYDVRVLTSGIAPYNRRKLRHMSLFGISLYIVDLDSKVQEYRADLEERLSGGDGEEIFYPLLIASMYPRITKALCFKAGTLLRCDPEELYRVDIGDAMVAGLNKGGSYFGEVFDAYARHWVGVESGRYVDTGAMLLNFSAFRRHKIEERFKRLITGYNFDTVSPAGDYLNFLTRSRATVINDEWHSQGEVMIATFDNYNSPWYCVDLPFADEVWDVARRTPFYDDVRDAYIDMDESKREMMAREKEEMISHARRLSMAEGGFFGTLGDNYLISER